MEEDSPGLKPHAKGEQHPKVFIRLCRDFVVQRFRRLKVRIDTFGEAGPHTAPGGCQDLAGGAVFGALLGYRIG